MTLSRNKSPDLRVVKTHKVIREAFIIRTYAKSIKFCESG